MLDAEAFRFTLVALLTGDDPLSHLVDLRVAQQTVIRAQIDEVRILRADDHPWEAIAEALGVDEELARDRFARFTQ